MKIIRPMDVNDAHFVSSTVAENDYAAYSGATTYGLADRVISVSTDVHLVYESVQAANTGHALTDTLWWLQVGATNRWKMFDGSVSAQTSATSEIDVTVTADGRADTVSLINIEAASARVIVTDAIDGTIYDETQLTTADAGITDWYAYFFEPIVRNHDLFFGDILPYSGATIRIILSDSGETVLCGECIIGLSKLIGGTQYGATVGIRDFSVKTEDDFGNFTILERAFAKRATFNVMVAAAYVDTLQELLADLRATPSLYIGSDSYRATVVYGFYKDFDIEIAYREYSMCSLTIEGLT